MPHHKKPQKSFAERLAAGEIGEKRKRYGESDTLRPDKAVDIYDAHARAMSKRAKQPPVTAEDKSVWESIETQRAEEGRLKLDTRNR